MYSMPINKQRIIKYFKLVLKNKLSSKIKAFISYKYNLELQLTDKIFFKNVQSINYRTVQFLLLRREILEIYCYLIYLCNHSKNHKTCCNLTADK